MADRFTRDAFQDLRAKLAQLTTLSRSVLAGADLAGDLHAAGQLADALRHALTDEALAALLITPDGETAVDAIPADPAWAALAPGVQAAATRNDIFVLLQALDWPTKRIINVLHKHCALTTALLPPDEDPTPAALIGLIATLDSDVSAALLRYLDQHWATAQRAALAEAG